MAQWLGFGAFPAPTPVQSLIRELRSLKLHSTATNKQKTKQANLDPIPMQRVSVRRGDSLSCVSQPHCAWGSLAAEFPQLPQGVEHRPALRQGSRDSGPWSCGPGRRGSRKQAPITMRGSSWGEGLPGCPGRPFGLRRSESQERSGRLGGGPGRAGGGKGGE